MAKHRLRETERLSIFAAGLLGRWRCNDFLTASVERTNANSFRVNCWRKRAA
jgi:hypothetical protein